MAMIGGLLIGGLGIGIAIAILIYLVQPAATPELQGLVCYRTEEFNLWYPKDSSIKSGHSVLAAELEEELRDLIALLHVDPKLIPRPIDVFVHPDISDLQSSIMKRKGPNASSTYTAPLDLLVGEDPRPRLAELVLAFGWGDCRSQILKTGMRMYAADPNRNFHAVVAGLPDRLFLSIPQLIRLEEKNRFPPSLYDQFDSPYSPAAIVSLDAFKGIFDLRAENETGSIPALESASLVQFLIEQEGGITGVRRAWGKGSTERLLARITPESITHLSEGWREAALASGMKAPDYHRWHSYYLLASGDPGRAYAEARKYLVGSADPAEIAIAVKCAISMGDFAAAERIAAGLTGEVYAEMKRYLTLFHGWATASSGTIRVLAPDRATAQEKVKTLQTSYQEVIRKLALAPAELPSQVTVFLYPDQATRAAGETVTPLPPEESAAFHLLVDDDAVLQLARTTPAYAFRMDTYSNLLRDGLAVALTTETADLVAQGRRLRQEGRWTSLYILDYGTSDPNTVRIEAGLMLKYVLDHFGPKAIRSIWIGTSPLGEDLSLDSAIREACGLSREELDKSVGEWIDCFSD